MNILSWKAKALLAGVDIVEYRRYLLICLKGPVTAKGKARSSQNALKHGMRSAEKREVERLIAQLGRLEREAQRNVELMWLTGPLAPDFKTIADFRKDNGTAIRLVCRQFVILCRNLNLFANAFVAIDGSKFKAINNRDRNFTQAKMKRRIAEVGATIDRYLQLLAEADRQEPAEDKGRTLYLYWASNCQQCHIKAQCATGIRRKMTRWEHEEALERAQARLDRNPEVMRARRATVEHPFGTLKVWMGATHFLTKTLDRVSTEMSLHVLAYNLKRMMNLVGTKPLIEAIRA